MLKIRIGLRYEVRAAVLAPGALYPALLAHAAQAERCGAELLWLSERPFAPDARVPAALPLCAAIAARTSRVRIGAGPLPLPLYHPLRLAEDAASLDGLSGGRLELALGLGADSEGFDGFGIPQSERVARFEEALTILRLAWRGAPIELDGRFHTLHGLAVWPAPVQPDGPPVWIAAGADTAVRRAARLGDGLLCPADPAAARVFLAAWRAAGRPDGDARLALELALPAAGAQLAGAAAAARAALAGACAQAEGFGALDLLLPCAPGEPSAPAALAWLALLRANVKSFTESTDDPVGTPGAGACTRPSRGSRSSP